ncbi:glycosyl hydrolase family 28-related protein [Chitinophaga sp. 30R24]|uniref:glycosyl hydrolase family 28-related protein n=1 Tax=Chitinophaga sp. 30R24 TaxID=3248838 RepID=UPI003B90258D
MTSTLLHPRQWLMLLFVLLASIPWQSQAQTWRLINPLYPTKDAFVAAYSVADYGATGDGVTDVTAIFQSRLDTLRILGGGTLFVPQGKYKISGTLVIPKGVTLRGEWQKPVKGQSITGTILMAYSGRGDESATPFITMEPSSAVMDMAIWYPEQLPGSITSYPPAILFGKPGYFGNDFCNTKNVTLVNAYSGVIFSRTNGGSCPIINGLYGTPLSRGVEIDNIADVGHMESIDFSPAYWSGSGLSNAPAAGSAFESWIYQNGTGIVMRRNDWSYTSFVNIEGYNKGFHAAPSIASPGAIPNGHNYGMTFTNCKTGIYLEVVSSDGIMFARCNTVSCETGVVIAAGTTGTAQFHTCILGGNLNAINVDPSSTVRTMLEQCTITKGVDDIEGGTFMATDCDFNNNQPQITLGSNARGIITGNRFSKGVSIQNNSQYTSTINHTPLTLKPLPTFPDVTAATKKPSRTVLYIATNAPFNAVHDGVTDNTTAIQAALNKASQDGGGVVFLPPGKYKVTGHLTVPTGVELKGASDLSTVPTGPGSIIEVYADKNNASGTPFLKLSANSGVRGITFDYPEQLYSNLPNVPAYPYLIQGTGSDIYIVNVGMRATYSGIDLFTYKCDNHYLDFVTGHVFQNGIRVGGNSANGRIYNLQFNTIVYAAGSESKFGSWPNSPTGSNTGAYDYNYANLDFLTLGNCQNEILYNDFVFGSHSGVVMLAESGSGPSGLSLGLGIDGSRNSMRFEGAGGGGIDFINSQIVGYGDTTTTYISTKPTYTGTSTFFNSDYWGNPGSGLIMNGGTINMQQANFHQPGQLRWGNITSGSLSIHNSAIWPVGAILNPGAGSHLSARASIIDSSQLQPSTTALWQNNLGNIWAVSVAGAMDRQGWTASASINSGNAKNALDSTASSRWDTQGSQVNGQNFTVDMKTVNTFHAIVLDASGSPNDSPAGYDVFTSNDGTNWGTAIASGVGNTGMTLISFSDKIGRYIKIVQTGSKSNYWSIHEFYVFGTVNVASVSVTPVTATFKVDSVKQLTAAILPVNATNKAKVWTSSNTAVATVDSNGVVKGKAPGIVTITVTTVDGNKTAISTDTIIANTGGLALAGSVTPQLKVYQGHEQVAMNWTANDVRWQAFVVERSDDGVHFYGLENVPAAMGQGNYQAYDHDVHMGDSYYRISAVGVANGIAYSNIVKIASDATSALTVYPNPVTGGGLRVQFPETAATGAYQVRLLNALQQPVYHTTVTVPQKNTLITIQWNTQLLPGYYLLEAVHRNGQRFVKPVVLQ